MLVRVMLVASGLLAVAVAQERRLVSPGAALRAMRHHDQEDLSLNQLEKRSPGLGFVGMRGKKAQDYYWDLEEDKRAAPSGFFGMRGKKAAPSGFFGMRGKKVPSGFFGMRGKKGPSGFLGMRGKKAGDEIDSLLELLLQQADLEGSEGADEAMLRTPPEDGGH